MNLNRVLLGGNLTRDPETRYTPAGLAVTDISIAVNRSWKDESGNKKEEVTFVDVTFFGRQAEVAEEYLAKGRPVFIEGRLHLDSWDDKQTGQKRSKLKVMAENLQLLGSKPEGQTSASAPPTKPAATPLQRRDRPGGLPPKQQAPKEPSLAGSGELDDDSPF
jgi:single-strand DNA-binding protein